MSTKRAGEGSGCLDNSFTRRRKFLVPANSTSNFFVWDSRSEAGSGKYLKGVKTGESRMLGSRWVVSSSVLAVCSGYKIHYVNIQTGEDIKEYTLPQLPAGFVFLGKYMYVLTPYSLLRFNKNLDRVPTEPGEEKLLIPNASVGGLDYQRSITTVGDKIFTRGNEEGILWSKSLKLLKRFDMPEENGFSFGVEGFGKTKVGLIGLNPKVLDVETGDFEPLTFGRRERRNLKSVLTFPDERTGLVSILDDIRVAIYKDSSLEELLTEFLLGSSKTMCVPFDNERLFVVTQQKSVEVLTFYPVRRSECIEGNTQILNEPLFPIPLLPDENLQETTRFTKLLSDFTPLDRDTAGVIAGFI